MDKLDRSQLWSLEQYAEERDTFRAAVMAHKEARRVALGGHATLYFEDFLTMKYQVQEMLRAEKIFTAAEINEEIDAYNPLIPDGRNWKATFMIEYPDAEERQVALARLTGVEHTIWVRVGEGEGGRGGTEGGGGGGGGGEKIFAIANEDLERSTEEKTAAVHFMRFELDDAAIAALRSGAALAFGCDHPGMRETLNPVPAETRAALLADLD
jgi:hypothetical protein